MRKRYLKIVFFISGFSALSYEIALSRIFITITGSYIISAASVTFAFLTGLAVGGGGGGKVADRSTKPYRLLVAIEALSALYIIASMWMISDLAAFAFNGIDFSGNVNITKFVFTFLLVFPYTFLIGGTLPLFVKMFFDDVSEKKRDFSAVYGINTTGAAFGALLAGLFFLNYLGTTATVMVSFGLSLLNVMIILLYLREKSAATTAPVRPVIAPPNPLTTAVFLTSIALSGFVSLSAEILWIRIISPIVGSSIYTISLTLVFYLAATAAGTLLYERATVRSESRWLCALNYLSGLFIIATIYAVKVLPRLYYFVFTSLGGGFPALMLALALMLFIIAAPVSVVWGAHYALVNSFLIAGYDTVSKRVGGVYFINTLFCVIGIAVTTFYLLPEFGLYTTLKLLAYAALAFSALAYLALFKGAVSKPAAIAILAAATLVALLPKQDIKMMNSGIYMMPEDLDYLDIQRVIGGRKVLFHKSGFDADVIAVQSGTQKYIIVGGKPVSNSVLDKNTQFMLGHLPMLTGPVTDSVLVIGFGSGVTAGDVSLYDINRLDAVEISRGVAVASEFFGDLNNNVNDSDKLGLFIEDGRFFVNNTGATYDVIISQPSNPWVPGASMLFTKEFFISCKERLADGGAMAQWYQLYGTNAFDLASEIATFSEVFDDVTIWSYLPGDIIMLGHKGGSDIDLS